MARGADGALWVGTCAGLARLDKDGSWQTYSKANTRGGLPDDNVLALAGARTARVGRDRWRSGEIQPTPGQTIRIVEVIGGKTDKVNKVTQAKQTIAVTAFDDSYLTQPGMFHYIWRLSEIGGERARAGDQEQIVYSHRGFST